MKDALKTLLKAKEDLKQAQDTFIKVVNEKYPFLMTKNISNFEKDINSELELLLSSCTRTASARIIIPCKDLDSKDQVVLTRKPGLRSPHYSFSAFELTDVIKIDERNDFVVQSYYREKYLVRISVLINHNQILQDRLKVFYDFMRETIELMKEVDGFISLFYHSDDKHLKIQVGKHRLNLKDKGFEFELFNSKAKGPYDKWKFIDIRKVTEYSYDGFDEEEILEKQELLGIVLNDFELFDPVLKELEEKKKLLIGKMQNFLNRLLEYNKPYKLLRKLLI